MSKIILFALVALFATTLISAATLESKSTCAAKHGDPCTTSDDCCSKKVELVCHRYANRCQVKITAEQLQEARRNLKHVEPSQKNYKD